VATALSGGTLASAWDYAGLLRLLAPHFEARPAMREVELAGPPENFNGSVHVTPAYGGGIELRTDRPDCAQVECAQVEGRRGCSVEVLGANGSDWYAHAWGIGNEWYEVAPASFWEGPAFARTNPHEVICDELCWRPTYALVSRVAGGPTPPADTTTTTNTTTTTYVPFNVSAPVPVQTPVAPSVTPSASSTAPAAPPAPVAPPVRPWRRPCSCGLPWTPLFCRMWQEWPRSLAVARPSFVLPMGSFWLPLTWLRPCSWRAAQATSALRMFGS